MVQMNGGADEWRSARRRPDTRRRIGAGMRALEDDSGPRVSGGRLGEVNADVCEVFAGWHVGESDRTSAKIEGFCALFG